VTAARDLRCPVTVLHGAEDPTPAESVAVPLASAVSALEVHVLDRCGHAPWRERHARERFYDLLATATQLHSL
jgi:pimeloyl-ACP methyl ester carboxylesterase